MIEGITIGIAGMTGMGKTLWISRNLSDLKRVIVVDPRDEHDWLPRWRPKDEREYFVDSFIADLSKANANSDLRYSVLLPGPPERRDLWLEFIGKKAYHMGNLTVIVDEADLFCGPQWENEGLRILHEYGRNRGVSLAWASRNLPAVARQMTAQTKGWVLFRQEEPLYLEKMEQRFDEAIVERVGMLEPLHYIQVFPDRTWEEKRIEL